MVIMTKKKKLTCTVKDTEWPESRSWRSHCGNDSLVSHYAKQWKRLMTELYHSCHKDMCTCPSVIALLMIVKSEIATMPIKRLNNENVGHIYHGMLFSPEGKKWGYKTCRKLYGTVKYYIQGGKPGLKVKYCTFFTCGPTSNSYQNMFFLWECG